MDPDPYSSIPESDLNTFTGYTIGESRDYEPYLHFSEDGLTKQFYTTSFNDNAENMVVSSAIFDNDYTLLTSSVSVIDLSYDEYKSIKCNDQDDIYMISEGLKARKSVSLATHYDSETKQYQKQIIKEVDGKSEPFGLSIGTFSAFAISNKQLYSITDRMNNFLIKCGTVRGLSYEAFKELEAASNIKQNTASNIVEFDKIKTLKPMKQTA